MYSVKPYKNISNIVKTSTVLDYDLFSKVDFSKGNQLQSYNLSYVFLSGLLLNEYEFSPLYIGSSIYFYTLYTV